MPDQFNQVPKYPLKEPPRPEPCPVSAEELLKDTCPVTSALTEIEHGPLDIVGKYLQWRKDCYALQSWLDKREKEGV